MFIIYQVKLASNLFEIPRESLILWLLFVAGDK